MQQHKLWLVAAMLMASTANAAAETVFLPVPFRVHRSPSLESAVVDVVDMMKAMSGVTVLGCDGSWCQVSYSNTNGYIYARSIRSAQGMPMLVPWNSCGRDGSPCP